MGSDRGQMSVMIDGDRSTGQPGREIGASERGFSPLKVDLAEAGKIAFCLCKRSVNLPRCDGTHRNL